MVIIYVKHVELLSAMLRANFQDHRTSGSEEDSFKGFYHFTRSHLGQVIWTIYTNFRPPPPTLAIEDSHKMALIGRAGLN